jgi:hypothetical protein
MGDLVLETIMHDIHLAPLGTAERAARPMRRTDVHDLLNHGCYIDCDRVEYFSGGIRNALQEWATKFQNAGRHDVVARAEISLRRLDGLHGASPAAAGARQQG